MKIKRVLTPLFLLVLVGGLFMFPQPTYADTGRDCFQYYNRSTNSETGNPDDLSNYVLVRTSQTGTESGGQYVPEVVCGDDIQDDSRYAIALWGINAKETGKAPVFVWEHLWSSDQTANLFVRYGGSYSNPENEGIGYYNPDTDRFAISTGFKEGETYDVDDPRSLEVDLLSNAVSPEDADDSLFTGAEGEENTTFSCAGSAGPLGWILCPVANGLLDTLDAVAGSELQQLLQINAEVANDDSVSSVVDSFRTFANTLLIVGFLVIIFAQAMSLGIDAYTIKRMLPRLALAVIAIQLSTPIAQILIDVFNVLGLGVADLILSTVDNESISLNFNVFSPDGQAGFDDAFGRVAQGGAVLAGAAFAGSAIWALILALPTILIVVIITVAMLIVRRLLLVALIILAPLAMAAWVLPNTEKWAKEWFDTFIKVLLMFPLIIGIIAIGKFMASVNTVSVGTNGGASLTFMDSLITLLAAFGPYLLIPFTYQFAGRLFGALGQMAGRLQGRALGGGGGPSGGGSSGGLKGAWQSRMNRKRTQMAAGQTKLTRGSGLASNALRRGSAPGANIPGGALKDSKTLKRLREQGKAEDASTAQRVAGGLAGAVQKVGEPGKRSQVRADDIAREANDALVQEGLKELEQRNISGSKEALRGLSFGVDKQGEQTYQEYRGSLSTEDAATADFYREQYSERLRSNPALIQAAQLQRASLGDMVTEDDYNAALSGLSGTSQLKRQHADAMIGSSIGSGVHRVMGLQVSGDGGGVTFNETSFDGAISTRTGEQLIRTNKHKENVGSTVAALGRNLASSDTRQTTASQVATILSSDTASPQFRTEVISKVYDSADTETRQMIDGMLTIDKPETRTTPVSDRSAEGELPPGSVIPPSDDDIDRHSDS